jgi:hypothetical protein
MLRSFSRCRYSTKARFLFFFSSFAVADVFQCAWTVQATCQHTQTQQQQQQQQKNMKMYSMVCSSGYAATDTTVQAAAAAAATHALMAPCTECTRP